MYRNGVSKGMLPDMEPGWLENFAQILIDDQDPKTGFWHDGTDLSLGLTFHLCNMHFRYYEIGRTDRADRIRPSFDLGLKRVPRAPEIIRTCLMMQSSYVDEAGVKRKAAWNWPAYRYTTEPDKYEQKCYLGTTWDAIYLMRLAARYVDADLRQQVYDSVKAAFRYVLHACVLPDGSYKARDTDPHPTKGDYMGGIMQDSAWLERKLTDRIPAPAVEVRAGADGTATFTWREPAPEHNSVRVYLAPVGLEREQVNERHLAGIIQRTGQLVKEMDPFLGVQKVREAAHDRWGSPLALPPESEWRGKYYLPWKLRQISYPIAHSDDLKPLELRVPAGLKIWVSACDWYGEESGVVAAAGR